MAQLENLTGNLRYLRDKVSFNNEDETTEGEFHLSAGQIVEVLHCEINDQYNSGVKVYIKVNGTTLNLCASLLTKNIDEVQWY